MDVMSSSKSTLVMTLMALLLVCSGTASAANMPLAILHIESGLKSAEFCAEFNPYYSSTIPDKLKDAPKYQIYQQIDCTKHSSKILNKSLFVTSDRNCSFFDTLLVAYREHAKQVIFIGNNSKSFSRDFPVGTVKQHNQVHLSVAMAIGTSWQEIVEAIGTPEYSQLYQPYDPPFEPNLVVIWLIAVFTVVTGAYWSGETLKRQMNNEQLDSEDKYSFPSLSLTTVLVFIVMICSVLLLLYYFYKYLIYVVIGIFAFAAIQGSYDCLSAIIRTCFTCGRCRVPANNLPWLKSQPEVLSIVLALFCACLSICWIVIRNTIYGWILQDFLGVCFCISLLKSFKLPNLKISTILLLALLVYDIFFVFITPFFSAQGKSVMVEVATGHGGKEQLPMVIKIPKIIKTAISACTRPYSLLGFGDILLPGLFVSFCHNFDIVRKTKYRIYFIATSIAYGFGLLMTFVALLLMKSGQPALLYLAPSVLLAAVIVALCRKELKDLWKIQIDSNVRMSHEDSQHDYVPQENSDEERSSLEQ